MKVLFVSSGNSKTFDISPFIKTQGESLENIGIEVIYFPIIGKGFIGYLQNLTRLRRFLKKNPVDIIHAHYSLSGWAAVLTITSKPIVLSLMGSDANGIYIDYNKILFKSRLLPLLTRAIQPFVNAIISKSANVNQIVYRKRISHIIPNGINMDQFQYKFENRKEILGLDKNKRYVLFLGSDKIKLKNFGLVRDAVNSIKRDDIELINPYPIYHEQVSAYLNAADVLVHSSFMEGSPNVIKEAMACNCPVVATDVGDVRWLFGDLEGYFIASFESQDFAEKIEQALEFAEQKGRTRGRQRIIELGLDSETVARKIIEVYEKVLS